MKGQIGDSINFIMAAAGLNFKKLMVKPQQAKCWPRLEIDLPNYTGFFSVDMTRYKPRIKPIALF